MRLSVDVGVLPDEPAGVVERLAARAVIRRGDELLLIRSHLGDLKFPGGGIEARESPAEALVREVREECGRDVIRVGAILLVVDERRPAQEPGWILEMRSIYLPCEVGPARHELALDAYEDELGLRPEWVTPAAAIAANEHVLAAGSAAPWVTRELRALEALTS